MKKQETEGVQLISMKELAQMLSVSRRQVFRLDASGKIPAALRIGGSLRFRAHEINAWIEAGCPNRRTWENMKGSEGKE